MSEPRIVSYKIHPGIGIARIGNSPDEFFLGPESLGGISEPDGGFKDKEGRIKRQACRFRVYGYDDKGNAIKEITLEDAEITWKVTLANTKASWRRFRGLNPEAEWRNSEFEGEARKQLDITPGERTISGKNQVGGPCYKFDDGTFLGVRVALGELRTDEVGRLLVLGGHGFSGTTKENNPLLNYANNDYWHDDVSDGPITASIKFKDGTEIQPLGSWLLVAPPKYAPNFENLISLYDVAYESAVKKGWLTVSEKPSFTKDIYPILKRIVDMQWLNKGALNGHFLNAKGNFLNIVETLANPTQETTHVRKEIFNRVRNPHLTGEEAVEQATLSFMPPLSGDSGDAEKGVPERWLKLTKIQYRYLEQWSLGEFEADWNGTPVQPKLIDLPVSAQPEMLDKTGLTLSVGGAFYPGIEATWIMRHQDIYAEPFRIKLEGHEAGDFTKRMAVPWQADFYECTSDPDSFVPAWWPAQRPNQVLTAEVYQQLLTEKDTEKRELLFSNRVEWARGVGRISDQGYVEDTGKNEMVKKWSQLGFIKELKGPDGTIYHVESERGQVEDSKYEFEGLTERDYYHILMNIDMNGEYLPTVRRLAQRYLTEAWDRQGHPEFPPLYKFFEYSPEALDQHLDAIYNDYVQQYEEFDVEKAAQEMPRKFVIERTKQMSPFNLIDGAWLQNAVKVGPIDEVHAGLFSIWSDEAGSGRVEQNHSNVYRDLLHSLGIYMPHNSTRAFVNQTDLFDSAFSNPVMQLSISQFPKDLFPEIIGMTLYLEWEATPSLSPYVQLLKYYNIDPHFYSLHVAIDNIASGHGAIAKNIVKIYLDNIYNEAGEEGVKEQWKRIWTGYICFATTGESAMDLINKKFEETPEARKERMLNLIRKKAPIAKTAHKDAGINNLNQLFETPEKLLDILNQAGYFTPGEPEDSRFMQLLKFNGPMYKVFTDEEMEVIREYIVSLKDCSDPTPSKPKDPGTAMRDLISIKADIGRSVEAHKNIPLQCPDGITKSVAEWFDDPVGMMKALVQEKYVIARDVDNSKFIKMIGSGGPMDGVFNENERKVIEDWINAGCPSPKETTNPTIMTAILNFDHTNNKKPPKIWGMGMVH
ncbi:LodA/GoxA family CTQ-dependent oxidase [Bacillus inaquosorum]|uniref:LodA/GoxA family CTQ-dependent oxidase n=1 Tax=Bacillus inaquosorum TaxID=483913 RepID=UPI00227DFAB0|nr:LodA/GoxA family CTQ-dependent oxidase [Bacillus inaquosorum]MCY9061423.1 LodA/GoxA family CTQ-dependent oxidase [Bacillus inaquosorum]MCY9073459.1 LodA/GoxA family CTQ-dependent oxidase [Bacillus inaquosorum]